MLAQTFDIGPEMPDNDPVMSSITNVIKHGDRVTIVNRFGNNLTGRAVMRGPAGWVLNMGGKHGTPVIANDDNIVKVVSKRP